MHLNSLDENSIEHRTARFTGESVDHVKRKWQGDQRGPYLTMRAEREPISGSSANGSSISPAKIAIVTAGPTTIGKVRRPTRASDTTSRWLFTNKTAATSEPIASPAYAPRKC